MLFYEQVFPFQNFKHQSDPPLPTVTHFVPNTCVFQEPAYNYFPATSEASSMIANDLISSYTLSPPTREMEINTSSSSLQLDLANGSFGSGTDRVKFGSGQLRVKSMRVGYGFGSGEVRVQF